MFRDEIKRKLGANETVFPFSVCMLSRSRIVVSGVKGLLSADGDSVVLRLPAELLLIEGKDLKIIEIGGGDIYVSGEIGGLRFERKES